MLVVSLVFGAGHFLPARIGEIRRNIVRRLAPKRNWVSSGFRVGFQMNSNQFNQVDLDRYPLRRVDNNRN